jgi:hypothetical protein
MNNNEFNKTYQDPDLKSPASQLKADLINKIDNKIRAIINSAPLPQERILDYDVLTTLEDLSLDYYINEDDLFYELYEELNEQIKHVEYNSQTDSQENYHNSIHLLQLRKDILKSLQGILTSRQLFALYHFTRFNHTPPFAPNLAIITRVLRLLYSYEDLTEDDIPNQDDFLRLVGHFHPQILNELIEILNNSEVIKYCVRDPGNKYCNKLSDNEFLTTIYFNEEDMENNLIKNN